MLIFVVQIRLFSVFTLSVWRSLSFSAVGWLVNGCGVGSNQKLPASPSPRFVLQVPSPPLPCHHFSPPGPLSISTHDALESFPSLTLHLPLLFRCPPFLIPLPASSPPVSWHLPPSLHPSFISSNQLFGSWPSSPSPFPLFFSSPCDGLMSVPVRLLSSLFLSLHLLIKPSNPLKLCLNNWGLSWLFPQHKTKQILGSYSICKSRQMPRRRSFCFLSIPFSKCFIFFIRAVYFGLRKSILLGPVVSSLRIPAFLMDQFTALFSHRYALVWRKIKQEEVRNLHHVLAEKSDHLIALCKPLLFFSDIALLRWMYLSDYCDLIIPLLDCLSYSCKNSNTNICVGVRLLLKFVHSHILFFISVKIINNRGKRRNKVLQLFSEILKCKR